MKSIASRFVVFFFCLFLLSVQNVDVVSANFIPLPEHHSGIYIRSDGNIDPSTSLIQRDGSVYTLTGNISIGIAVECSNIIIDGNGFSIQGNSSGTGLYLKKVDNVTLQNVIACNFNYGICLEHSNYSTIKRNKINDCGTGIIVSQSSMCNQILENTITDSSGINNYMSTHHTIIADNNVTGHGNGISVVWSNNVTLKNNKIKTNTDTGSSGSPFGNQNYGVYLDNSNDGKLYNNTIEKNMYGIHFWHCSGFHLSGNVLRDNDCGIQIEASSNVEILASHTIDTSNTINQKPVYYLVNQHDILIPDYAGWVAAINCTNITVCNSTLAPNGNGILFAYTTNSKITDSNIAGSYYAIKLQESSNCTISRNLLCNSGYTAVYFDESFECTVTENNMLDNFCIFCMFHDPEDNKIFRNNFIDNEWIGAIDAGENIWDNGSQGNYWKSYDEQANYDGVDENGDGIGDAPYVIDNMNNVDRYPLMNKIDLPDTIPEFPSCITITCLLLIVTFVLCIYKFKLPKMGNS